MTPVFDNVTLKDLYDTCVCQCYIGNLFETCVCQCLN